MIAFEVRYSNRDKKGMCICLCENSADEIPKCLKAGNIEYTQIDSVRPPRIPFSFGKINKKSIEK